jgi:ferrous iron transport protein A
MENDMEIPITDLKEGESGIVVSLAGGGAFQRRLRTIGIREGKIVKLLLKQPFGGPFVVEIDRRQTTIGRGMARRIIVRH